MILFIIFINILAKCCFIVAQVEITAEKIQTTTFDYVIIGGGSAGSVVVSRLSEQPQLNVLLIEAGGYPSAQSYIPGYVWKGINPDTAWMYQVEPQTSSFKSFPNQQFYYPQGKVLGGGSTLNVMVYSRGNKEIFDNWAKLGLSEWSFEKILPYFLRVEGNTIPGQMNDTKYHNTSGPLTVSYSPYRTSSMNTFLQAAEDVGLRQTDYNAANQTGASPLAFTMRNGSRCSAYVAFVDTINVKSNLFISINSTVTKILFDNNTANGVEILIDGKLIRANATKEVILSAGTFASPKILMHSGIGPKNQLRQFNISVLVNLAGVGENLQDHIGCNALVWKVNCTDCTDNLDQSFSRKNQAQYYANKTGPLSSPAGAEALAFSVTKYGGNGIPDIEDVFFSNSITSSPAGLTKLTGISLKVAEQYFAPFANATATFTIASYIVQPKSRGYVRIGSSDPTVNSIVNPNFLKQEKDVLTLIEGVKTAKSIGDSRAFKALGAQFIPSVYPGCESYELYSDDYWNCTVRSMTLIFFHPVGTCKMGLANDSMAVVDSELKVFGVQNLRVVDASIMPLIPNAHTNAPTMMIAEKASDLILSRIN